MTPAPLAPGAFLSAALLAASLLTQATARLGKNRQPYLVKLWKEHARNASNGTEVLEDHEGGYFVGAIWLGSPKPQEMHAIFATTTGMVTLPSSRCDSPACREHHTYSPWDSEESVDVQRDGSRADPKGGRRAPVDGSRDTVSLGFHTTGDGANQTGLVGNLVSDRLCFGELFGGEGKKEQACVKASMIVATSMDEASFRSRPQDGMVGLALHGLSISPGFNLLDRMSIEGFQSRFGIFVEDDAHRAELVFGGHDASRLESPLEWVPVVDPTIGHWLVKVVGIRVGGKRLDACRGPAGCRGMVDTGSPTITVPETLHKLLRTEIDPGVAPSASTPCFLPDLELELEGGVTLTLRVEDYAGPRCSPVVLGHGFGDDLMGGPLLLLGEPVLRRYYTVFDWGSKRVGFGRAAVERSCKRLSAAGLPATSCSGQPLQDEVVLLSSATDYGVSVREEN